MKNQEISNHANLILSIKELNNLKILREKELKRNLREIVDNLSPMSMIKNSLHELAKDKEIQLDLTKVGLKIGAEFLIDKIFGRNKSIKGFLSSLLAEKVSSSLINNNLSEIISGVGNLLNSKIASEK